MRVSSAALRRAGVLVAVGLAVAVTCTFLGRWQWHRHVVRDTLIATVQANWSAPAAPLASLVPAPDVPPAPGEEWRSVEVTGHYLTAAGVLLRNRPVDGRPAYHVLVPFAVDGGAVLVVDRGWVPLGSDAQGAADVPGPPAGPVDLVARLRMPEAPSARTAPSGQVQAIDPAQVLAAGGVSAGTSAYRWYAAVVSESPAPAATLGPLATPSTDPGPHLSYAVQWWTFALAGLFAFGWMARREVLDDLAAQATAGAPRPRVGTAAAPSAPRLGRDAGPAVGSTGPADDAVGTGPGARPTAPRSTVAPAAPRRRSGRDELAEDAAIDAQLDTPRR